MFKKQIKHLSLGGSVFGLSEDLFALFLNSFMQTNKVGTFLFVSDDDVFNKDQSVRSVFFNKEVFYYPDRGGVDVVPGFQSRDNYFRSRALIGLLGSGRGVCITTARAASLCDINKKTILKNLTLCCGDEKDRDVFVGVLLSFGYVQVDSIYSPREVSVRGDIVDVYPENTEQPVRISFNFNTVEGMAFFNVDTQRKTKNISSFMFYDLIGGPIETGSSLLDVVRWQLVISVKKEGDVLRLFSKENSQSINVVSKKLNVLIKSKKDLLFFAGNQKHKNIHIVYTNKNRIRAITKMGATPVAGLIKNPHIIESGDTYLPD